MSMKKAAPVAIIAIIAIGAGLVLVQTGDVQARAIEMGEKMPSWTMTDHTGTEHSMEDFEGKVIVMTFTSQKCPWSKGFDPHVDELAKEYSDDNVVFVHVDSHRDTPIDEIAEYMEENELSIPVLKDEGSHYAAKVKASRTPEVFLLNEEGELVYHGAYDNRKSPEEKGETNYVAKALDEVLAGNDVSEPEVSAWGCTIKFADNAGKMEGSEKEGS